MPSPAAPCAAADAPAVDFCTGIQQVTVNRPQLVTPYDGPMPLPFTPRTHQVQALAALEAAEERGQRRAWVVMPPGAGKTLVGLAHATRFAARTVVLCPNTAIQSQWVRAHRAHWAESGQTVGTDRDLSADVTVLTYQSVANFNVDAEVGEGGEQGEETGSLVSTLHPNGRELVASLQQLEEVTLVLDECHHLLQAWGRLLDEVLEQLPRARVLGLTATPAQSLSHKESALTARLFGEVVHQSTIAAAVREGDLAPFGELAWLTTPTTAENDWLAEQSERFDELITTLTDPTIGPTSFLPWLDSRLVEPMGRERAWAELATTEPELADAALRLHHHGLLTLPDGARPAEQHRHSPTSQDWVTLIGDWVTHHLEPLAGAEPPKTGGPAQPRTGSQDSADAEIAQTTQLAQTTQFAQTTQLAQTTLAQIRRALPAVGYQLTRRGIRRSRSPVDRVLARSEAKTRALVQIGRSEQQELGDAMRLLVICDHERATATVPTTLRGVLDQQAGSARLALGQLTRALPELDPILMTGRTVAGLPETLERLRSHAVAQSPHLDLIVTEDESGEFSLLTARPGSGGWTSRTWVPLVTQFFEGGQCRALIGTRGLLGEGWDARSVTSLIDLTAATTATSVVQTRGRALRTDPKRPQKVALNWSVVCVTEDHPGGASDWDRLVRKHQGFFATDESGAIVDGVAHLSAGLSPYAPPPVTQFDTINAAMTLRAGQRDRIRDDWQVGSPYQDQVVPVLRVQADRAPTRPGEVVLSSDSGPLPSSRTLGVPRLWRPTGWLAVPLAAGALVAPGLAVAGASSTRVVLTVVLTLLVSLLVQGFSAAQRGRAAFLAVGARPTVRALAASVADTVVALAEGQRSGHGAAAVRVEVDPDGSHRCALDSPDADARRLFTESLDELLAPMASPRYVISRPTTGPDASMLDGLRAAFGRVRPSGQVWHGVPEAFGRRRADAETFAAHFDSRVGGSRIEYTGSPEGAAALQTNRGLDPFAATTVTRLHWR